MRDEYVMKGCARSVMGKKNLKSGSLCEKKIKKKKRGEQKLKLEQKNGKMYA